MSISKAFVADTHTPAAFSISGSNKRGVGVKGEISLGTALGTESRNTKKVN
jgi:hypothetical protein